MKLVDILALQVKVWPHGVKTISQSASGELRDEANYFLTERLSEYADDGLHQCVTRAQWQAAVDALKTVSSKISVNMNYEVIKGDVDWFESDKQFIGKQCLVRSIFTNALDVEIAAVEFSDGCCLALRADLLRAIRTPEQIAADQREAAISSLKKVFDSCSDDLMPTSNKYLETLFGAIHDAGFRKPEDKQ